MSDNKSAVLKWRECNSDAVEMWGRSYGLSKYFKESDRDFIRRVKNGLYFVQLVHKNDAALKAFCAEVPHGEDVSKLIAGMSKVMRDKRGVGLAAPQVGVTKRVIVIEYMAFSGAIINPVIVKCPGKLVTSFNEGCLSFPGVKINMKRHKRVVVEGFDENWNPIRLDARNFLAFIVQHEVDHLNGVTIV